MTETEAGIPGHAPDPDEGQPAEAGPKPADIVAAVAKLRELAAIVRQVRESPHPEGLTHEQIMAREQGIDAALASWDDALAEILFEMYAPHPTERMLSCYCGGYHVLRRHTWPGPDGGEREILVGPCADEDAEPA